MPSGRLETIIKLAEDVCAREPIHQPGAIQPHGVLIGFDGDGGTVLTASANLADICPTFDRTRPRDWLPPAIWRVLAGLSDGDDDSIVAELPGLGPRLVHCFAADGVRFVEFEHAEPPIDSGRAQRMADTAARMLRAFATAPTIDAVSALLVDAVHEETGFERVVIYRFDADGNGDVVAESLDSTWGESLLGLRFPASDIPAQARALYCRVHQRWTPARDYLPVPLEPQRHPVSGEPFNIGLGSLRAVSPVHTAYQRNLGVDGAMAHSIMQEGRLWGLVVGHSRTPCAVPVPVRQLVGHLVDAFSMRLSALMLAGEAQAFAARMDGLTAYLSKLAGADSFVDAMLTPPLQVGDMFDGCSGVAIVHRNARGGTEIRTAGETPPAQDVRRLMEWLRATTADMVAHSDCIAGIFPAFSAHAALASGVLAAFLCDQRDQAILWFRPEAPREIAWGGKPEKIYDPASALYLPRRSFARWVEKRSGHAQPWQPSEVHAARVFADAVSKLILRLRHRIDALNSEVERFLWVSSHHLREAPRRIAIDCELIGKVAGTVPQPVADLVADIRGHALLLDRRLRGLVAYSEFGQPGRADSVRIADALAAACNSLAEQIRESGAEVRPLGLLPTVAGDLRALSFVLECLIENALTFRSPDRRPDIRLWAERTDDVWQLSVADNGIGIEEACHEKVFELFETLRPAGSARGIGLGLTLCRRIVERLDGRIWLHSVPGHGTIVHVSLPATETRPVAGASVQTISLLRNATRELHELLSRAPVMAPMAEGRITPAQYLNALAALVGYYRPAEEMLFSRFGQLATELGVRPKLPSLLNDVTALGLTREAAINLPVCAALPDPLDSHGALGMFYVLEGATLGGQVVLRRISHCLGAQAPLVTSFHGFHGDGAGEHWRRFQARLGDKTGDDPQAQTAAVTTAVATFSTMLEWITRGFRPV